MREQFEKLPEIRDSLSEHIVFIGNTYTTPSPDFYDLVNWLNGAWHAFQEQQKVINGMLECMDDAIRLIDEGNSWDAKELLK